MRCYPSFDLSALHLGLLNKIHGGTPGGLHFVLWRATVLLLCLL